jgi:tripartite-type tricarboxylate transporter receptor subunit TctC
MPRRVLRPLLALMLLLLPGAVFAQEWPTKPIRIIYNYPAGTSGDVLFRMIGDHLAQKLGQAVIVENRAGASGTLGVEAAWRTTADNYTFLLSPNAPMVLLPQLRKVPYDRRDFRPIAAIGEYVYGWAVLPNLGVKSVAELVALAKSKPGVITVSTPGAGTATHLRSMVLNSMAGMDITPIHYRGGPEALNDFLGGHVNIMLDSIHYPHARAGRAMILAFTSSRRHPEFPDVPTMEEAGYKIELPTWLALYAIKGTAEEPAAKLGAAVNEIIQRPDVNARIYTMGFFPMTRTPAELKEMNDREVASYEHWVKKLDFKME